MNSNGTRSIALKVGALLLIVLVVVLGRIALMRIGNSVAQDNLPDVTHGEGKTDELVEALAYHRLSLPSDAEDISYTTSASIDANKLGIRFETSVDGVDELLASMDRGSEDLVEDLDPWTTSLTDTPDRNNWNLDRVSNFSGIVVESPHSGEYWYALLIENPQSEPVVYLDAVNM